MPYGKVKIGAFRESVSDFVSIFEVLEEDKVIFQLNRANGEAVEIVWIEGYMLKNSLKTSYCVSIRVLEKKL